MPKQVPGEPLPVPRRPLVRSMAPHLGARAGGFAGDQEDAGALLAQMLEDKVSEGSMIANSCASGFGTSTLYGTPKAGAMKYEASSLTGR